MVRQVQLTVYDFGRDTADLQSLNSAAIDPGNGPDRTRPADLHSLFSQHHDLSVMGLACDIVPYQITGQRAIGRPGGPLRVRG